MNVQRVLKDHVAAISCGIHDGQPVIDLDYLWRIPPPAPMPISS